MTRPPIVVILGHVDHGKTTLLDFLRHSHVAAREAGGITQNISSFQFRPKADQPLAEDTITFIDTPGHEAFSQMRRRGSGVADIAVLVVAADDGVKPQTRQSIEFIKNSQIPFIVAINKSDVPTADADRVKTQLTEENVVVEDFGGDVPCVVISAKTGKNISELLELIHLVASLNPKEADLSAPLELVVLESKMDSRKGPLAAVVVKNGQLQVGQELFQDVSLGRVKNLLNSDGQPIKTAVPSEPIEILGLSQLVEVGSIISSLPIIMSVKAVSGIYSASSTNLPNLIIRADVAGSLEAILNGLKDRVNIISSGTGDVIENDVLMAHTSGAQVLGFNLKVSGSITKLAETEKVTLKFFSIIYELFQYVDELLNPKNTETITGKATVLADFKINSDRIAGCRCTEGFFEKSAHIKVLRGDNLVGETRIKSLQQGKTAVERVKTGIEFGAVFSPHVDFKIGDAIIATIG
jgi:translation initiation factor IF-2